VKKSGRLSAGSKNITWDLSSLFQCDDDPAIERNLEEVRARSYAFIDAWKDRTDYLTDPAVMRQALDDYEAWQRQYGADGDAGYYIWLRTQQDQNDPKLKAKYNKIEEFSKKIGNDSQFFLLRIAKIPPDQQERFLNAESLGVYRHFLSRIFAQSRYLLSEAEEKVLNLKTSTSHSNWVKMIFGFLSKEERIVLLEDGTRGARTMQDILTLMNSKKKSVRDTAAAAFNDILGKNVEVAEAELNSVLANKKVDDELRGMARPDLGRHISDDIESDVVDSLIAAVSDRFDIARRYYRLKARLLKVRRLKYHERNVEYGRIDGSYPFSDASALVLRVMRGLDDEFAGIYDGYLQKGQIDVFPRKGKTGGAFCVHHLLSQPTFILLNHTNKLHDVLTIAHELGHGINNELMRSRQNALNFGSPMSTAEVASTFLEDFVLREVMRDADDDQRLAVMMMKLNDDVSTIFRQVACYRFEQELHAAFRNKGYLSKEEIGALFRTHMAFYMGDAVAQSKGSENWWVYWSHIRSFFYVYSYASGLLISKSLQHSVRQDAGFITKVKGFLAAGVSDSPKNIFSQLGVDISDKRFWGRGLDEVEALLDETTSLAKKLRKFR
jgi:oligoendopeptidase F